MSHTKLALITLLHLFLSVEGGNIAAEDLMDSLNVPFHGISLQMYDWPTNSYAYLYHAASSRAAEIISL